MTPGADGLQFLPALCIKLCNLREYGERLLRVTAEMLHGVDEGIPAQRGSVGLAGGLIGASVSLEGTLAHYALAYYETWLAFYRQGLVKGLTYLHGIVAADLEDLPAEGAVLGGRILVHDLPGLGRELDVVGVVEHYEVVQSEHRRHPGAALADFLLYAAVRNIGIYLLFREARIACVGREELGRNGRSYGKDVALAERARGVLDAADHVEFRMSRGRGTPLAQGSEFIESELAAETKLGIEHRSHVSRIEEETVTGLPVRVFRIVPEILGIEDIDEVRSAHRSARMAGLGFFDCCRCKYADVVRRTIEKGY